jgi:hypothetical protein
LFVSFFSFQTNAHVMQWLTQNLKEQVNRLFTR